MSTAKFNNWQNAAGSRTLYPCLAWVRFSGAAGVIQASGNVSSVTRNSAGDYTLNFAVAMVDTNYTLTGNAGATGGGATATVQPFMSSAPADAPPSTTSCRFVVNGTTYNGSNYQCILVHGNY